MILEQQRSIFSLFANSQNQNQDLKLKIKDPAFSPRKVSKTGSSSFTVKLYDQSNPSLEIMKVVSDTRCN